MELSATDFARVRDLYNRGCYRQALDASAGFGPLRDWKGAPGRLLAGRLAMQLGAPRLGRCIHLVAFRQSPAYLEAVYYHARYRFERFGPLASWQFMTTQTDWADASPDLRADWHALQGFVVGRMFDFDRAERYLNQAEALAPNRAWLQVERAAVLEVAERHTEALASARRALQIQPWFRPAVQAVAHILQKTGKDGEAVEFLTEASTHLESGIVAAHLAALQLDQKQYAAARYSLNRYEELSPLIEPEGKKWLSARRADIAYALGERDVAATEARKVGEEFYTGFAERLTHAPMQPTRVQLPLDLSYADGTESPSVCALLSRFWNRPASETVADGAHPHDGIPDFAERKRLTDSGWITREFTLSAESAFALLDAGLPFLITLVEVGVSQSRLAIGYDATRRSLYLCDGHERRPVEAPIDVVRKRYAASGPRCLVAVPQADVLKFSGIVLPDADRYDDLDRLQLLLADGKYADAKIACDALIAIQPGTRWAKLAAIIWARGTVHPVLLLDALDDLIVDFPTDPTLALSKAAVLRELGRIPERYAVLRAAASLPDADPLIVQSLAQMLLTDPRAQLEADHLLRKSIRGRPQAAAGYFLLASQRWEEQCFTEGVDLYRFASCLDDREEQFAEAYFRAAKVMDQSPEALRMFQRKATRADVPFPPAVRALFGALWDRDEPEQAFSALARAIEKLQANGEKAAALAELRLFRAEMFAQFGRFEESDADREAARAHTSPQVWHRTSARIARMKPDLAAALDHLQSALSIDPNWVEGHRIVVAILADTDGQMAARAYLGALVNRYPYTYPVLRLRAEFDSPKADDTAIHVIRETIALCPHDAWARRQLALVLADQRRDTEALEQMQLAADTEPTHPSHFAVLAHVHRRADRIDDALETYRKALRSNVDHELAVGEWIRLCRSKKERRKAVRFIVEQLHTQPHAGDGLVAYRDQTLSLAADDDDGHGRLLDELYTELDRVLDERPDLWQAWSLMIQQLGLMHRLDEAHSLAEEATERFPLLAQLWSDLARVRGAMERNEERIEALRSAVAAAPAWSPASHELADALSEDDQDEEAVRVLERAVARSPQEPTTTAALADRLWAAGRSEDALARAQTAVRLDPGFDPAWRMVMHWSDRLERPDEVLTLARELTRTRPGDPRGWLKLARLLHENEQGTEALAALDTVIRLDPRNIEAHDQKAERLAELGRYAEALEAARPAELVTEQPLVLQGRAAWVEAKRGNYAAAIPPMQALVSVEPEYFWGWQQLAEWYNETGRVEGFLEAASELVRLKPDHPLTLTMRGEAKLKTGDRSGGKADLRDALRIAAQYAPAAAILFDACLEDGETREAQSALAVLQEHAGGPEVLVKQVQFACRTDDAEAALRTLAELAETPMNGSPLALQLVLGELLTVGWGDRAATVLKDAWQSGGTFNPWAPLYWLDTEQGESASFDERISATDAAIRVHPQFPAGYDRKAELLSLIGQFDEAFAVCHPAAIAEPLPITLRGRAAWVEAKRGNLPQAIVIMKQVVAIDPEYLWGWRNLAQWYDVEKRFRECLDAADRMVKLSPKDPVAYGYRGEAKRTLGDRSGAKDDFQKAFDLDPTFDVAGLHLVAEQLEIGDATAAAETLSRLQDHTDSPLVRLRATQVAAQQGDLPLAQQRLRSLAIDAEVSAGVLRDATTSLDKQGWTTEVEDILFHTVNGSEVTTASATVWAERLMQADLGGVILELLPALYERLPAAGRAATLEYATAAVAKGRTEIAATTIHLYADELRIDDLSWAKAGAILHAAKSHALAATWLSDWKARSNIEPWMLISLMSSLRVQDRDAEANDIAQAGLAMYGPPATLAEFRSWLALVAAMEGRTYDAQQLLLAIDSIGLPDGTRLAMVIADSLVMVQSAGTEGKKAAFNEAKERIKIAADTCAARDVPPGLPRWYKKAVARLAADAGLFAKAWVWWQQLHPWVKG